MNKFCQLLRLGINSGRDEQVLGFLGGEQTGPSATNSEILARNEVAAPVQMPDLIDTGDSDDFYGTQNSEETQSDQIIGNLTSAPPPLIDDLFGEGPPVNAASTSELKNEDDPFSDVSFHTNEDDVFSGMTFDSKQDAGEKKPAPELFDIFGSDIVDPPTGQESSKKDVVDLMGGLSVNENGSKTEKKETSFGGLPESLFSDPIKQPPVNMVSNDAMSGVLGPQAQNFAFPQGAMAYNIPPGLMFNPAFAPQQLNYGAMGNLFAQHLAYQQQLGNMAAQNSVGVHSAGSTGGYSPAIPDIFQANYPSQVPNPTLNGAKKEETKAFDFISVS